MEAPVNMSLSKENSKSPVNNFSAAVAQQNLGKEESSVNSEA